MVDFGAYLNCITDDPIPSTYYTKATQVVKAATRQPLIIEFKISNTAIRNYGVCITVPFILGENLSTAFILGNPSLHLLFPLLRSVKMVPKLIIIVCIFLF